MAPSPDASIATVAVRQHGAFALRQARDAGFTEHQVRERVRIGRWNRLARAVFAIAGTRSSWQQQAAAALLARPAAHLADLSAGQAHGLVDAPLRRPSLVVPPGTSGRAALGTVRRLHVPEWQLTEVDGLRCTTVGRTLVEFEPPERQIRVTDGSGEVIARLDLGWPEPKVALEYDGGAWHSPSRWASDEDRHRSIEAAGWTVLHVGGRDLLPSSDLPARLRLLLDRRTAH